ncbi:META and DUF4377 domain-containing protein [Psychrobacter sp. SCQQ22]|uniref:META domain-containing protein n=1 Tax=unclassified Psychrobacter TaxID=196806 RepID=UPI0018CDE797|nr:META domain-containing protein [Psychrobacter sp. SCQQ22]MBH0085843.1 META and DUF4377 domain-containing protein [Psychrobacter sp. SCQQ22]
MTSFVRKQPVRLGSLPRSVLLLSMLATSLALSACHGPSDENEGPNDTDVAASEVTNNGAVNQDASNTDAMDKELIADKMSVEDVMISNLSRYRWTLISATDSHDQPLDMLMQITDQVRLSLNQYQGQNTLNYSVGCNTISATYQLQGSALTVEDSMSTKMSCGDLNKAEDNLSTLMQGDSELVLAIANNASVDSLKSDIPILTQTISDAATLVWQGKLTPQARYSSKGEAVFWAVSADMVACADNNPQMCLRVKPVTYNSQGIKINEGKWRVFIGEIDGYQHDGQHEEVLRLQRYRLDGSDTAEDDTSNTSDEEYAYVLDAVIESSVVE